MSRKRNQKKVVKKDGEITNEEKAIVKENSLAKIEPLKDRPFYHMVKNTHTGKTTMVLIKPNRHKSIY